MFRHNAESEKRNNKGFSLVEMIIVIAIMVALIAVMAPQFVQYVQKARDAAIVSTSEAVLAMVKTEYAEMHLTGYGTIWVYADENDIVTVKFKDGTLAYSDPQTGLSGADGFYRACCSETDTKCHSDLAYKITITQDSTFKTELKIEQETTVIDNPEQI